VAINFVTSSAYLIVAVAPGVITKNKRLRELVDAREAVIGPRFYQIPNLYQNRFSLPAELTTFPFCSCGGVRRFRIKEGINPLPRVWRSGF